MANIFTIPIKTENKFADDNPSIQIEVTEVPDLNNNNEKNSEVINREEIIIKIVGQDNSTGQQTSIMPPNAESSITSTATFFERNAESNYLDADDGDGDVDQTKSSTNCNGVRLRGHQQMDNDGHNQIHQPNQLMMVSKKLVEKAGTMEHAMMSILHNAWNLRHFHHLPQWLQDNDFLLFGHRPPLASFTACFWSIFRLHTETMNIWTHGLGCICFVFLSIYLFVASAYATIPMIDKIMLGIFLFTAILCLAFSTCYHTLACHSHQVLVLVCKLDYCGISLLIAGSIVPCLYYAFYCSLYSQISYTIMTIFLCAASVTVSFSAKFSEPQYRPLRAAVFFSYAFFSFIPAVHWFLVHSDDETFYHSSFRTAVICLTAMAILYIIGAVVYALRIPERFCPGKFDFYFHSHQLFHIFVILAAICHLRGITSMADFRLFVQQSTCQL
ncbi:adiponectin receptor-like protein [Euroglyphus maynei]|uniref:Adiponectin receptor-like protein n=1 Tax=Euroglyphus maynei TaxID=6958 RepID=A0A1Y3BJL2_EURMA|nr:adiponectin receptor-like protein [Euroglyphus maynei]